GEKIGRFLLGKKLVFCLEGDLGSGKTTFVKGVARGLGISEEVRSPTFVMLKEYGAGDEKLVHVDAYRLGDDFEDIGLDDYFDQAIVMIEWANNIGGLLPEGTVKVGFEHLSENERQLCFWVVDSNMFNNIKGVVTNG
ncbi:tRNA (adenosine(37)-N6)-threonylcarbamoyltransferase complex ATPase subunit type 1 TsaE, partial [Patescibacteria group bacterium]|nr:tRNA (adenosine(37)-N6)-threonylcarbamoyltransferase complex ATPase subunit type 1 TsaE [Patescibacteria group bacterium]